MVIEERNKKLMGDFIETWNSGKLNELTNYWSPDIVHHTRADHDRESIMKSYATTMQAFPDLRWDVDDIIAEGDKVVARLTGHATHTGEFMGVPPTNKKITCRSVDICRIQDDQIVEHWGLLDELAISAQLDLIPEEYLSAM